MFNYDYEKLKRNSFYFDSQLCSNVYLVNVSVFVSIGRALTTNTPRGNTNPGVTPLGDTPCAPKRGDEGQGYICVCNSTYCDTIQNPDKLDQGLFYLYKTSNSTPGFTKSSGRFLKRNIIEANGNHNSC